MTVKRAVRWALGLIGVFVIAVTASVVNDTRRMEATLLQACMQVDPQPAAWLCEQFFYRTHPTPEEVRELNAIAGAKFASMANNESDARRVLKHYLDAGVDINAVDQRKLLGDERTQPKFTALHIAVLSSEPIQVRLLLEFGASREVRDAKGRTPLELARELQGKHPTPEYTEIVRLLEGGKVG